MSKIAIVATKRYCINACDFHLLYHKSKHAITGVYYHESVSKKSWFPSGKPCPGNRSGISSNLASSRLVRWKSVNQLIEQLSADKPDYVCIGNGNCEQGLELQSKLKYNYLYSEYGFLPWNSCFWIDPKGAGAKSSVSNLDGKDIENYSVTLVDSFDTVKRSINKGKSVPFHNFIYVPLQVDSPTSDGKPDFKFNFTKFKSNSEFLHFIGKLVQDTGLTILFKEHPSSKVKVKPPVGMVNITEMNLNKYELYSRMKAMVVINSTSAIEAMMFGKPIFTYGDDVFSNKGIVYEKEDDTNRFLNRIRGFNATDGQIKFLNLLSERQIDRRLCSNQDYIDNHYWTSEI